MDQSGNFESTDNALLNLSASPTIRTPKRWFASPPGYVHISAVVAIVLLLVYLKSLPGGFLNVFFKVPCLLLLAWPCGALLILVDYFARVLVCLYRRTLSPRQWRWYITPICLLIVIHAWRTEWPLHWRWEKSLSAFEQAAQTLITGPGTAPADHDPSFFITFLEEYDKQLGTYRVVRVSVHPDEKLVFFMTGGFFRADWGFLYNPTNRKDWFVGAELSPGWYTYEFSRP